MIPFVVYEYALTGIKFSVAISLLYMTYKLVRYYQNG